MIKRILFYIFSAVCVFASAYLMPNYFVLAFNFSKDQANEDGFLFIPIGFFLIVVTVLINVLLIVKAFKMNAGNSCKNLIVLEFYIGI